MAEDSPVLNKMLVEALTRAGYTNLTICSNGEEAWEILRKYRASGQPIQELLNLVITDVEMPQMDGHRLLKLIRSDEYLESLPVVIFSSIIDDDMRRKGDKLGATAQLSKPEIGSLIDLVDSHIL
jgi:two-component system chemotaxis response regulator CheV